MQTRRNASCIATQGRPGSHAQENGRFVGSIGNHAHIVAHAHGQR